MCNCYKHGFKCDCVECCVCNRFVTYGREVKAGRYTGTAVWCDYTFLYTFEDPAKLVTKSKPVCINCVFSIKCLTGIDLKIVPTSTTSPTSIASSTTVATTDTPTDKATEGTTSTELSIAFTELSITPTSDDTAASTTTSTSSTTQ